MQPTNTDVDYEKALRNYFHYNMTRVYEDAHMLKETSKHTRMDKHSIVVHDFIYRMMTGEEYSDDDPIRPEIGMGGLYPMSDGVRALEPALRLQEYLHDWNDVVDHESDLLYLSDLEDVGIDIAVMCIDVIVNELIKSLNTNDDHLRYAETNMNEISRIHKNIEIINGKI